MALINIPSTIGLVLEARDESICMRHNRKFHSWSMINEPNVHQEFYGGILFDNCIVWRKIEWELLN